MKPHYITYERWPDGQEAINETMFLSLMAVVRHLANGEDDGRTFRVIHIQPKTFSFADITETVGNDLWHISKEEGGDWVHPLSGLDQPDPEAVPQDPYKEHRFGHHEHFGRRAG